MIERYVRLNETIIFRSMRRRKSEIIRCLPITLDLEEGRIVYRAGLYLPFLGKTDVLLRIKYLSDFDREETKIYMEDKKEQGKHLIIKTDNDSQEFLRYCIVRYYKSVQRLLLRKKWKSLLRRWGLSIIR